MSSRTPLPHPASAIVVVDADDVRSSGASSIDEVVSAVSTVRARYVTTPADQVWVASRPRMAERLWFDLASPQTHFVVGPVDAGGRAALIPRLDVPWLATRFETLVVMSGRPSWVPVARAARDHGMSVHLVRGSRPVPEVLLNLADEILSLRFTTRIDGTAA